MKRITTTLLMLSCIAVGAFSQAFSGVSWVAWEAEPDYADVIGYAENPYDKPTVVIPMAPDAVPLDLITDATTFDAAWALLGAENNMAILVSDEANGDPYDLDGDKTFGAQWKGVHDGTNLYIFSKYYDTNAQMDAGTQNFEIMVQPTSHFRHETSFQAATNDSLAEHMVVYQNMAYGRYVELGGGKAVFQDGSVGEYAASVGLNKTTFWKGWAAGAWGGNDHGLEGLAMATHFWDVTDGVIRGITIFSFDGALGYPTDPTDLGGDYTAVKVGDTISFDIKSRGTIAEANVEYHWSSDRNNCYASTYYAGNLVLAPAPPEPGDVAFSGVSWVAWENEPDYVDVTGYAENPYDKATADILLAPDAWTYESISDAATFDATWDFLGDAMAMDKLVSDPANGDLYDLDGDMSFGAQWKGVHDGANLYVFTKYYDTNAQLDAGTHNFEIMVQPTSADRHENSFLAASNDSGPDHTVVYQNMAYARVIELGGGKAVFQDGAVGEYAASVGLNKTTFWKGWAAGAWGGNDHGLEGLAMATHFWDVTDGVIRGITVFSFDGALGYPAMPDDLDGDYLAVEVGDVISFDLKSRGSIAEAGVEYHWSSDRNNCYASTYYAGNITLSDEQIVVEGVEDAFVSNVKVFVYSNQLHVRGVESANVNIYSITGSLVKSAQNVSGTLDISELINGVYFVKLEGLPTGYKVVK